jgi:hypothetical protein
MLTGGGLFLLGAIFGRYLPARRKGLKAATFHRGNYAPEDPAVTAKWEADLAPGERR